jgi:hypothetical protein
VCFTNAVSTAAAANESANGAVKLRLDQQPQCFNTADAMLRRNSHRLRRKRRQARNCAVDAVGISALRATNVEATSSERDYRSFIPSPARIRAALFSMRAVMVADCFAPVKYIT